MTLSTTSNRVDYTGTGTTGPFPYPFKIFAAPDLDVRTFDPVAGLETVLAYVTDYSVAGAGVATGGSIALAAALAVGTTLTIRRIRPVTQVTTLRDQGAFLPEIHEDALDHQVMIGQQHTEALGRALQLPVTTLPSAGISPVLPPPEASMAIGWDATAKRLVNVAAGGRGPAGVGGPIPIFADAAARDAFYPVPAVDNDAIVKSLGYQMRFGTPATGANQWLREGVTRAAGPVVSALSQGAKADGVTDDSRFLAAMDAAVIAYNDGGWGELDPSPTGSWYYINTNFTFNANLRSLGKTARIKVGAGKNVHFAQDFDARLFRMFDLSAAGSSLTWDTKRTFQMEWFVDPASADATAQFNAAFANTPDYMHIFSDTFANVKIKGSINITNTRQKTWTCRVAGFPDGAGYTVEWWGPMGGSMFQSDSNDHLSLINCAFRPTPNSSVQGFDGYIAAGSNILHTAAYPIFDGSMVGRQIWVKGIGAAGADVVANITAFTNGNQVTLSVNATTAVLNTALTAFVVGPSADSLPAGIGVEAFGDIPGGATGTANTFKRVFARSNLGVDWYTSFYVASDAPTGQNNQEYHHLEECTGTQGLGAVAFNAAGTINAGSAVFNAIDIYFALFFVGRRFRLLLDNGTIFDTKIIATNATIGGNGNQVTLKDVAPSAATLARIIVGESFGVGFRNGASPNAKRQILENNTFAGFRIGCWIQNGSFLYLSGSMTNNECDFQRDSSTEPSYVMQHNSEAARRLLLDGDAGLTVHAPIRFTCGRFGSSYRSPGKGFVRLGANSNFVSFSDCQFDDPVPTREIGPGWTRFYEFQAGWNGKLSVQRHSHEPGAVAPTIQALGYDQLDALNGAWSLDSDDEVNSGLSRSYRVTRLGSATVGVVHETGYSSKANDFVRRISLKAPTNDPAQGLIVDVDQASVSATCDLTAIDINLGRNFSGGVNAATFRGVRVNGPLWNDGGGISADLPYFTGTPPVSTGGSVARLIFADIPDLQANGHVTESFALRQLGLSDKNLLNGLTTFGSGKIEKATVYVDIGAGGNATPNPAGAEDYRYRIAGAATINAPVNPQDGMTFTMEIFNNTGGAITPTLNAVFLGTGYGAIGAGKSRTRRFVYDGNVTKWKPVGAVSEDL